MTIPLVITWLAIVVTLALALNAWDKLRKTRAQLAAVNQEYSDREAAYAIAQVALKHLSIWQKNQLQRRYDRASQEAEMIKKATEEHRLALEELRTAHDSLRSDAVIQFVAGVRGLAESGRMKWEDALLHAEAQFVTKKET